MDKFIGKVRGEVQAKCAELLGVVDALCKAETRADAEVFYLKMAGGVCVCVCRHLFA